MISDDLRKWVDKDRMGTHWDGCWQFHKDCAILAAADAWDEERIARHMEAAKFLSQIAAWKASCMAAEKRLEAAECPDKLTAGALARLIEANKVPSPWRDTGTKLRAFGKWLAALAGEEKP
jgi:hypothetical protein